ncbi:Hypothetical protein PBC10988_10830 [Planctomycetales bacterium 10988]|nr:Hypothetical protein PBC10988_10830 [Planctomycetales bacterium 10988]
MSNATWYLRLPAGNQYGPITEDQVRQWVRERRVTPDSMIWNQGWPNWKKASEVFPELAGGSTPSSAPGPPQVNLPRPGTSAPVAPGAGPGKIPGSGMAPAPGLPPMPTPPSPGSTPSGQPTARPAMAQPAVARPAMARPAGGPTSGEEQFFSDIQERETSSKVQGYTRRRGSNLPMVIAGVVFFGGGLIALGVLLFMLLTKEEERKPELTNVLKVPELGFEVDIAGAATALPSQTINLDSVGSMRIASFVDDSRVLKGYMFMVISGDDFNASRANDNKSALFAEYAKFVGKNYEAQNISQQKSVQLGNHAGEEFTLEGDEHRIRAQVYLIFKRLFFVGVLDSGEGKGLQAPIVEEYFKSFRMQSEPDVRFKYTSLPPSPLLPLAGRDEHPLQSDPPFSPSWGLSAIAPSF